MSQDPTLLISGTVLFSGLVGLGGYLVASSSRGREDQRERKRLAREMKARVDEHYATYLDLETRVKDVIEQFDRVEEQSKAQISEKDACIHALQEEIRAALTSTEFGADHELGETRDHLAESQGLLAALQEEKRAELEEHALRIGDLQDEIERLREEHRAEVERLNARAEEARPQEPAAHTEPESRSEGPEELENRADEIDSLQNQLADFEPLQTRIGESEARVQELLERCEASECQVAEERERHAQELQQLERQAAENAERAEMSEREAQSTREQIESAEALVEAARGRAAEAEEQVATLRASQADGVQRLEDEHGVLLARVQELEPLTGELTELRDQCVKLERNAKRHGTRARNLELELAAREEEIRELGADPKELAAERKARVAQLRECVQELGKLAEESDRQDEQLARLASFNAEHEAELEAELGKLSGIERGLTPLFDTVDCLIDSLSEARGRITALEAEATETQAAHEEEQTSLIELLRVAEDNIPNPEEIEHHELKMRTLEDRYEGLLAEKEVELTRLEECVAEFEPLKAAVEDLSSTLSEKTAKPRRKKSTGTATRKKRPQASGRKKRS